jgi:hypothetical protein
VVAGFVLLAGTALYALAFLLPWYGPPAGAIGPVTHGRDELVFGVVPLVLFVSAAVVAALPLLPVDLHPPTRLGPVSSSLSAALAVAAGAALVLLRLALPVQPDATGIVPPVDIQPGLYLAAVAALANAVATAFVTSTAVGPGESGQAG